MSVDFGYGTFTTRGNLLVAGRVKMSARFFDFYFLVRLPTTLKQLLGSFYHMNKTLRKQIGLEMGANVVIDVHPSMPKLVSIIR